MKFRYDPNRDRRYDGCLICDVCKDELFESRLDTHHEIGCTAGPDDITYVFGPEDLEMLKFVMEDEGEQASWGRVSVKLVRKQFPELLPQLGLEE